MKGDHYRYLAELPDDREENLEFARIAYDKAFVISSGIGMIATHPMRLGLALNYSVFYHEIIGNCEKACEIAKKVSIPVL